MNEDIRIGGAGCAGFQVVFYGKGVGDGRAVLQPVNGAILAHCCRFRHDGLKHEVNLARSSVVKLKHAQNKFCGLAAVIQSRMERGQSAEEDGVFHVKHYFVQDG